MTLSVKKKPLKDDSERCERQIMNAFFLEKNGFHFKADCLRAEAHYLRFVSRWSQNPIGAFRDLRKAKYYASEVARYKDTLLNHATYEECTLIGTILLKSWLWAKSDPATAKQVLYTGMQKFPVPPYAYALMQVGIAESYFLLGKIVESSDALHSALNFEQLLNMDVDKIYAHKQFCIVLRRAFVLSYKLGRNGRAKGLFHEALMYANDPRWENKAQLEDIQKDWRLLLSPRFIQTLFPH